MRNPMYEMEMMFKRSLYNILDEQSIPNPFGKNKNVVKHREIVNDMDDREVLYEFEFKTEIDTDVLQSYVIGSWYRLGVCRIWKSKETRTRKELMIEHYERELEIVKSGQRDKIYPFYEELPSSDMPYVVYLFGCDYSSCTRCYKSMKDIYAFIDLIASEKEPIDTSCLVRQLDFIFTN
ncbi:MAG: hypothetical protein ACRCRT_05135 [Cetobacterium somerae]